MKKDKKINCLFIFNDPFPIGQAATNRMLSIAKGLSENAISTSLLVLRATETSTSINNPRVKGIFEGVKYEYLSKSTVKASSKLGKLQQLIFARLRFCRKILSLRKSVDIIIYPLDSFWTLVLLRVLLLLTPIKILRHVDEYPPYVLNPDKYSTIATKIHRLFFYKLVDAVLPMTKKLEEYYKTLSPKNISYLHLPMTVDIERFSIPITQEDNYEYITYCGNLGHNNKDGLPDLIRAFSMVNKKHNQVALKIIGGSRDEKDIIGLKKLAQKLSISNNVYFTGNIPRDEIPKHLCNSKVLVLSRPNNKQAEGGFPTKLGEYLATGKPVVVTSVGEIPYYLTDKTSAFIAKPSNYNDFGQKLIEVLDNYKFALKVGQAGKEVAIQHFDYKRQGKLLSDFIKTIL